MLVLRRVEERSLLEIVEHTGWSLAGVKRRLARRGSPIAAIDRGRAARVRLVAALAAVARIAALVLFVAPRLTSSTSGTRAGLTIVSPAVNFCGSPCNTQDPFDWLDRFFAACPGCRVDYLAVRGYACTKDALSWCLKKFESTYRNT